MNKRHLKDFRSNNKNNIYNRFKEMNKSEKKTYQALLEYSAAYNLPISVTVYLYMEIFGHNDYLKENADRVDNFFGYEVIE